MPLVFLPAAISGIVLWMAFFPVNLGFLAFGALVPWLSLVRVKASRRRRYLAAYLGGFTFFVLATQWVRVAHPMMYASWIGLALVLPLFWVVGLDLIRRLDRFEIPLWLSVPVVWVALEYARMHFPTGYPFLKPLHLYQMIGFGWYFLGYSQHAFLPLIQIADVGGVYGVSFLVAACNGLLAEWAFRSVAVQRWLRWGEPVPALRAPTLRSLRIGTAAVLVFLLGSLGYGFWALSHPAFSPGPRVAAIQGSVPQAEKNLKGQSLAKTYAGLHLQAMKLEPPADLIVWPETCFADDWFEIADDTVPSEEFARIASKSLKNFSEFRPGSPVLLGLNAYEWQANREWRYNSALLLDTLGRKVGRYDKMHLVPFGEYVPLKETFPFMSTFTPYKWDYSCRPGESWTRFPLTSSNRDYTFGCLICYEDSDPYLARQYVTEQPVDFLVNISNDGWFDGTEEHEQHLAICRFRAIEARRPIVRSVNMGISAVIDSDGRVVALPGESWGGSKKMEGIVSAIVPIDTRPSWYARIGDWLPAACWMAIALGCVLAQFRTRS